MPRRADPMSDAGPDAEATNEEKILSVLKDAKADPRNDGDVLGLAQIAARTGIGHTTSVYLTYLTRRGLVVRVARGRYRLPRQNDTLVGHMQGATCPPEEKASCSICCAVTITTAPPSAETSTIDDEAAEEIRAAERERIAAELAKALADAVPKEAIDYIRGFQDGANYVAERVLGLTLPNVEVPD